jgi:hypothetical protein
MRILKAAFVTALLVHFTGCGDSHPADADPFDTFQACFDDHHIDEMSAIQVSIKICCIDHPIGVPPIGPNVVCGETSAACQTYVDANLDNASATMADIIAACDGYIIDRAK